MKKKTNSAKIVQEKGKHSFEKIVHLLFLGKKMVKHETIKTKYLHVEPFTYYWEKYINLTLKIFLGNSENHYMLPSM